MLLYPVRNFLYYEIEWLFGKHELQAYINPVFHPFSEANDDYGTSDSSSTSPRDQFFWKDKVESSNIVVMSVMAMGVVNLEEESQA